MPCSWAWAWAIGRVVDPCTVGVVAGAYLRGADLRGADLRDAYLQDADLDGAWRGGANEAILGWIFVNGRLTGCDKA